ncbi:MAG TPA: autotransporter-associated beta strand repeat-containing protein, partial [Opitutus sp.]|nr:autotransporter-associated beta strand repeat-containing protein [Opitutus sp.]
MVSTHRSSVFERTWTKITRESGRVVSAARRLVVPAGVVVFLAVSVAMRAPAATTLTIGTVADLNGDSTTGDDVLGSLLAGDHGAVNSQIKALTVGVLLTTVDLSLAATDDVTVSSSISWASFHQLQLNSSGTLNIDAGITNTGTGSLRLFSTDAMALGATLSVRDILIANDGALTQSSGTVTASSSLELGGSGDVGTAGTPITINTPELLVDKTGGDVFLSNAGALDFDYVSTTGDLSVTANGAITASSVNPMTVGGTLTVAAGATHDITLGNTANDFATVAITSGKDVTVVDANAIDLGTSTVSGDLNVTASGAITQSGPVSVTGETTLAAGSTHNITLDYGTNDFATVTVSSGKNVSLADTNGFDLNASSISGTLTLSAATVNLEGAIAPTSILVDAGTLKLAAGDLIGNSTGVNLTGELAEFNLNDFADTVGWIAGVADTTIELGTTGTLATTGNASTSFAGTLDGGADTAFTKGGSGTLTLSGDNSFAGALTANAGTIALAGAGSRGSGAWTFNNSAVLKLSVADALDACVTGATIFNNSAKLSAQTLGSITGGTQIFYNTSSLQVSATGGMTTGDGVITGGEQDFHDSTLLKAGVTNSISGGTQNFDGTAVLTASGDHAITGGTQNFTTALDLFDESPFVLAQTSRLVINGGGNDAIAGGTQNFSGYSSIQANRSNAIAGGTQNFSDYAHLRASQTDAVVGGEQYFTDHAYLWPTATNAVVGVTVDLKDESSINIGATNALDASTNINFNGCEGGTGGSLLLNGYGTVVGMIASIYGNSAGLIGNGAATNATLTVDFDCDTSTFGGLIQDGGSGTLSLTKSGSGTLELTGNNTYTGGTRIDGGTLVALNWCGSATGSEAIKILGGATLQIGNGGTKGSVDGDIMFICDGGSVVFERCNTLTYGGVISGNGSVTTSGSGEIILTGANTYTDGTYISAGTLTVGASGTLPAEGYVEVSNGATFNVANDQTIKSIFADVCSTTLLAACATLTLSGCDDLGSIGGTISGDGRLTVTGGGTLTLSGDNSYTGRTKIDGGTLIAANDSGSATGAGEIKIAAEGILQIGDGGSNGSVDGNITFDCDGGTVVFNRCDALTYGGVISGNGSLEINGSGEFILTGANTYTGGSYINSGTLTVGACDTLPTGGYVEVANGATFNVAHSQTIGSISTSLCSTTSIAWCKTLTISSDGDMGRVDGTVSGGGALAVSGGGYLTLA